MDIDYTKIVAIFLAILVGFLVFKNYRQMILGAGIYRVLSWIFDNPIWISAELMWGAWGMLAMAIAAVILNICLFIYFKNKQTTFTIWNNLDGLVEKEKEYQEKFQAWRTEKNPLKMFLAISAYVPMEIFFFLLKIAKVRFWGDFFALIILSIFEDPFVAITYLRHGDTGKISSRIIFIFSLSMMISIGYWLARNGLITELFIRPVIQ